MAQPSLGAKVRFPERNPAFTVNIPPGWTSEPGNNGNWHPPGDDQYQFSLLELERVRNRAQLKPELLKFAASANLKGFKLGPVQKTASGTVQFQEVKGRGEWQGSNRIVVVTGFEATKGRFFALFSLGPEKNHKKHEKEYEGIAASIKPLSAAAPAAGAGNATSGNASSTGYAKAILGCWLGSRKFAIYHPDGRWGVKRDEASREDSAGRRWRVERDMLIVTFPGDGGTETATSRILSCTAKKMVLETDGQKEEWERYSDDCGKEL